MLQPPGARVSSVADRDFTALECEPLEALATILPSQLEIGKPRRCGIISRV
jgi:hypothetical protein